MLYKLVLTLSGLLSARERLRCKVNDFFETLALDRKDNIAGGPISDTPALNVTLIVLDGFDKWSVGRFA